MKSTRILTKPLRDNLIGAIKKTDQIDQDRITQQITDCINFLLIELERIDLAEVRL
jgi:hypothetical protein